MGYWWAAHSIKRNSFHNSLWEWELWLNFLYWRALRHQENEWARRKRFIFLFERFHFSRRFRNCEWNWFCFLFFGGLWPLPAAGAPPKEREQSKNQLIEQWRKKTTTNSAVDGRGCWWNEFMEWIHEATKRMGQQQAAHQAAPAARQVQQHKTKLFFSRQSERKVGLCVVGWFFPQQATPIKFHESKFISI